MSYEAGAVRLSRPECDECKDGGMCARWEDCQAARSFGSGHFYLPHSCDQWVIGTRDDAKQLIADLRALLKETP